MPSLPPNSQPPEGQIVTVRHCPKADCDIQLWYDTFGDPKDHPLIIVVGLQSQAPQCPTEFCEQLASSGFYVLRVENRDVGLSSHLDHMGEHSICCLVCCTCCVTPKYTLYDFAADIIAFADTQKLEKFSLLGSSMGGMICQVVTSVVPDRILSLNLLYTSPGAKGLSTPSLSTLRIMAGKPKNDSFEAAMERYEEMCEKLFFGEEIFKEHFEWAKARGEMLLKRSQYKGGGTRHAASVMTQVDRTDLCKNIKVPTLILHGDRDPVVGHDHGVALHKLIPNSKMLTLKGMMHSLAPNYFDEIIESMVEIANLPKKKKEEPKKDDEKKQISNEPIAAVDTTDVKETEEQKNHS